MKKLIYGSLLVLLSSCAKDNPGSCCMNVQGTLNIVYKNAEGQNLLDETTPGHYSTKDMKLFHIIAGQKKFVYNYNSDSPEGMSVIKEGIPRLHVGFNLNDKGDITHQDKEVITGESTSIIQLNESVIDTVKIQWQSKPGSLTITKAWYKSKLVFDPASKLNGLDNHLEGFVIQK
ncbi:hypothetical protein ACTHQF_05800 [Pedobacter sp. SAFR-022]|uniref:hypothetical protein n=1 Tax=Pedobacter sp. SAFR-022 TaxID=3436861 RepID=UPI003F802890